MKTIITSLFILLFGWSTYAQQVYQVEIEPFQEVALVSGAPGSDISVPNRMGTAILGGAYDTEGLGKFLIFKGTRLNIESFDKAMDGNIYVMLRRSDGRDFFNKFPLLKAKLVPVVQAY